MELLKTIKTKHYAASLKNVNFLLQLPVIHIICRSFDQGEKLEFVYIKTEFGKS